MAYIFASDPNALAGQRNYYDAQNIQLAQTDRALRQKALDDERQAYLFVQERDRQDAQQAAEQAYRFSAQAHNDDLQAQQAARQDYQFGAGMRTQAEQAAEQRRQFDIGTGLKREEIAATKAQYGEQKAAKGFGELATAIQNGEVNSPDQIDQVFSFLPEEDRKRGKVYLGNKAQGLMDDWKSINNAALAATSMVIPETVAPKASFWSNFIPGAKEPEKPAAPKLTEEDAMKRLMASNSKTLLQYAPLISWSEDKQAFEPITKPPAYAFGANNAPARPPAVAPPPNMPGQHLLPAGFGAPAPVPPRAPAPAYSFPTNQPVRMNLPPAAANIPTGPAPPVSVGPQPLRTNTASMYKVGAVYKGGLQYLGGDPNDARSWRKVQ